MCSRIVFLCFTVVLCLAEAGWGAAPPTSLAANRVAEASAKKIWPLDADRIAEEASAEKVWRVMNKCPITSLYIILRLHNKNVSYQEVEDRLMVGSRGSSLAELRDCAISCGLHARVVKGTPENLSRCPLPALAHCDEEKQTGHYVVILALENDEVHIIDGTTAMRGTMSASDFCKRWSGHLIIFERIEWWRGYLPVPMTLGFVGVVLFTWGRWRGRRSELPRV